MYKSEVTQVFVQFTGPPEDFRRDLMQKSQVTQVFLQSTGPPEDFRSVFQITGSSPIKYQSLPGSEGHRVLPLIPRYQGERSHPE